MPASPHRLAPLAMLAVSALSALCAALAAGCGSGASTAGSSSSPAAHSAAKTSTNSSEGLKVIGTPKFGNASGPVRSGLIDLSYLNVSIRPDTLRAKVGSTVRWTNHDPLEHNVTSYSGPQHFASGNFGEGRSYSVELTRPGKIDYLCTNHPATMNGVIEVVG